MDRAPGFAKTCLFAMIVTNLVAYSPNSAWAGERTQTTSRCEAFLEQQRFDPEATSLIASVHNRLARAFKALLKREERTGDIDAVESFNAESGLPATKSTQGKKGELVTVDYDFDTEEDGLSHGLRAPENRRIEISERKQILSRLGDLHGEVTGLQHEGPTKMQFAKVFRGRNEIRQFLGLLSRPLRHQFKNRPDGSRSDEHLGSVDGEDLERAYGFDLGLISLDVYRRDGKSRIAVDFAGSNFEVSAPSFLEKPILGLFAIWGFPGPLEFMIADEMFPIRENMNRLFSWIAQRPMDLSLQEGATIALAGYTAYELVTHMIRQYKNARAGQTDAIETSSTPTRPAPIRAEPPIAISAQYGIVVRTLVDLVRGHATIHPSQFVYWRNVYNHVTYDEDGEEDDSNTMSLDLMLIEDQGEPVLVVVNQEL